MGQVPKAFISPDRGALSLAEKITYGARVTNIADISPSGDVPAQVRVDYETGTGSKISLTSKFLILAVPYTAQRAITKSCPFTPALEQAIRGVRYIEITKILLQYQKRWWQDVFRSHSQGTDGGLISDLPIRYTIFPGKEQNTQFEHTKRGGIMESYTFQQDATFSAPCHPSTGCVLQLRICMKSSLGQDPFSTWRWEHHKYSRRTNWLGAVRFGTLDQGRRVPRDDVYP